MPSVRAACVAVAVAGAAADQSTERVVAGECVASGVPFVYIDDLSFGNLPSTDVAAETETDINVASLISMDYADNFKVLTHNTAKEQYVLTQCGTEVPSDADIDKLKALPAGYSRKHFSVPVRDAVAVSTTALGFVEALDIQDRFRHISAYATGACFQKAQGCGDAGLSSDDGVKKTQMSSADVVFMDCGWGGDCTNVNDQANGVLFSATQDAGNLHSAEYVKYLAAFFNLEPEAKQHFQQTLTRYNSAAQNVAEADKLLVVWLSYNSDSWSTPPRPHFVISQAKYKLQLVEHAGGRNLEGTAFAAALGDKAHATTKASGTDYKVYIDEFADLAAASSALFAALSEVDAVIDETYEPQPETYTMAKFLGNTGLADTSELAFVKNDMVIRYDGKTSQANGLDWFESRIAYPDAAVQGLARVLLDDATLSATYFRNVAKNEAVRKIESTECDIELPACAGFVNPKVIAAPAKPTQNSQSSDGSQQGTTGSTVTTTEEAASGSQHMTFPRAFVLAVVALKTML